MARKRTQRPSLFDYLDQAEGASNQNKYCSKSVLEDEASVEDFFASRLIEDLGYTDEEIKPKSSLQAITIARGRKKENFRPDYALVCTGKPRWLMDAKATSEDVDNWAYQGAGYALGLNKEFTDENPCRYYVITNGLVLKVFKWDEGAPILAMTFGDFIDDHPNFLRLRALLDAHEARRGWATLQTARPELFLTKPSIEEVKRIFNNCHRLIWKTEKMSPQPAFFEFVKIMFVKLWEDRKLHEDPTLGPLVRAGQPISRSSIVFSTKWIEALQQSGVENAIDSILFKRLAESLREGVARGRKKPVFEDSERIKLQPGTIKQVVAKLELYDLFGIDEDLNGRLFETFLSATMRGEDLGQYFTPRSIVKLMVRLAAPVANRQRVDRVLDGCCGTGGFLIEVLTEMRNQIRVNASLTSDETDNLMNQVTNDSIFGVDAGREPPIAIIARINMYLHGDGGSRIYAADSLDKTSRTGGGDSQQGRLELEELKAYFQGISESRKNGFDIVLTNPPFSMDYSEALANEEDILRDYKLRTFGFESTSKHRPS